jgi:hypothetical protein
MAHVGYVSHIPDFIIEMQQVAKEYIESQCCPGMPEVGIAIYRGSANI